MWHANGPRQFPCFRRTLFQGSMHHSSAKLAKQYFEWLSVHIALLCMPHTWVLWCSDKWYPIGETQLVFTIYIYYRFEIAVHQTRETHSSQGHTQQQKYTNLDGHMFHFNPHHTRFMNISQSTQPSSRSKKAQLFHRVHTKIVTISPCIQETHVASKPTKQGRNLSQSAKEIEVPIGTK